MVANNLCNFLQYRETLFTIVHGCVSRQGPSGLTLKGAWEKKEKCANCNRLNLTPALILFGYDEKTTTTEAGFDYILLVAKYFIYKCRINKTRPRVQGFLKELTHMYKIDKFVQSILMKQDKFALKQLAYQEIVKGT